MRDLRSAMSDGKNAVRIAMFPTTERTGSKGLPSNNVTSWGKDKQATDTEGRQCQIVPEVVQNNT